MSCLLSPHTQTHRHIHWEGDRDRWDGYRYSECCNRTKCKRLFSFLNQQSGIRAEEVTPCSSARKQLETVDQFVSSPWAPAQDLGESGMA